MLLLFLVFFFFFNAVNTKNTILFIYIVLGMDAEILKPKQMKPKLSAWLDSSRGKWENMLHVIWVNWPFKHSHSHCGCSLLGQWEAPQEQQGGLKSCSKAPWQQLFKEGTALLSRTISLKCCPHHVNIILDLCPESFP